MQVQRIKNKKLSSATSILSETGSLLWIAGFYLSNNQLVSCATVRRLTLGGK